MKHFKITVKGKVQGVWFRKSTLQEAERLGVKGRVRNQSDGTVYIEAEAPEVVLTDFINWCRKGPETARVDDLELSEGLLQYFNDFRIEY